MSAHYNLGVALMDEGELDEAIASLRRVIELQPDLAGAHYTLGKALRKAGKKEEAKRELAEAKRLGYKPE